MFWLIGKEHRGQDPLCILIHKVGQLLAKKVWMTALNADIGGPVWDTKAW